MSFVFSHTLVELYFLEDPFMGIRECTEIKEDTLQGRGKYIPTHSHITEGKKRKGKRRERGRKEKRKERVGKERVGGIEERERERGVFILFICRFFSLLMMSPSNLSTWRVCLNGTHSVPRTGTSPRYPLHSLLSLMVL